MGKIKRFKGVCSLALISIFLFLINRSPVHAQSTTGKVIHIGSLDTLLWSIVATIQWYTLPLMAIALVFLGINLLMSGEDAHRKSEIKGWAFKIILGAFIIFGATTIAEVLKSFLIV